MNRRFKKIVLVLAAAALVFGAGRLQQLLNHDRDTLGLTRTAVLENAPPGLAFTTVALGGFRGLISNFLWIRANDLQQDDKLFEAAQLANWITKLEPTFTSVWIFQAWNMAYNISVKFKPNGPGDYSDRWRWVQHGIQLLRDEGLRYNPNSILIYRELAWFFQHKLGQSLDDGNMYYKQKWAEAMTPFFGPGGTNFDRLLHPQTAADFQQLQVLTNEFKIDPVFAKATDDKYGPFDWRLPEAHAIYWGAEALQAAAAHPDKVKEDDLITARRIIYQSLLQSFRHGRIISDPFSQRVSLAPNLELVGRVNQAYLDSYADEKDPSQKSGILKAHRNFLRYAVYFLYEADRMSEAQKWFNYLAQQYPDLPIIDGEPNSLPRNLTLDQYAVAVIQVDIGETSQENVTAAIGGLLLQAYYNLAIGEDDRYQNLKGLAARVYDSYTGKAIRYKGLDRMALPPFETLNETVIRHLLDPQSGVPYAARAALATQLRIPLPKESVAGTNAAPEASEIISTNAPATNAVSPVP
jgi:hypothetical protein